MSTTIHLHIEVLKDGQRQHFSATDPSTDNVFLDLIAGIRGNIPPLVVPRGLPGDMSGMTSYCYSLDEKNFHPHHRGWLSSEEVATLQRRLNELQPEKSMLEKDLEEAYLHCYISDNAISAHRGFDDSRIVFWFDN